jgi:hypothetical protein
VLKHNLADDEDDLVDAEQFNLGNSKKINNNRTKISADNKASEENNNAETMSQGSLLSHESIIDGDNNKDPNQGETNVDTVLYQYKVKHPEYNSDDQATRASRIESTIKNQLLHLNDTVDYSRIRNIKLSGSSKRHLHPIEAEAFATFETALFDLLGFTEAEPFKLPEISVNTAANNRQDLRKLRNIINNEPVKSQFITDMSLIKDHVEMNAFSQIQLKKVIADEPESRTSRNSMTGMPEDFKKISLKPKLATVILNKSSVKPRKALRILLTKRNTISLDAVLNELSYLFKLDVPIRRIYSLSGEQVSQKMFLFT